MQSTRSFSLIVWVMFLALASAIGRQAAAQEAAAPPAAAKPKPITYVAPTKENYRKFADETEAMLRTDVLGVWFPRTIDNEHGGFYSNFTRDWKPGRSEGKFSVAQGRMTWMAAEIVMHRPELKDQYLPIVKHGVEYLRDVLWDKQYGGFYWGLGDDGKVSPYYTDGKHLYGISFGLYGAAAAYQATKDPAALELAQRTFRWMEEHAHDDKNGGYFEWLTREGKPVQANPETGTGVMIPVALFPAGYKSMNTHIHLLESFSQLYEVWKDEALRRRVEELLAIVRDKVSVEPGVMNLYFTNDWRPIPDHDSYGHDVEAGYLMLEAEDLLGHGHDPRTERMAKLFVDHALAYGWDENFGGFYRDGTTFGKTEDKLKEWWVQFEGLNALLLMHEKYGQKNDAYFKAFQRQWRFLRDYQRDSQFHGIHEMIGTNGAPTVLAKGRIWKEAYHDGRALLNVTERLHNLAEAAGKPVAAQTAAEPVPCEPVNPQATTEVRALLKTICSVSGKAILSGQHNYPNQRSQCSDHTAEVAGKYPYVWGSDFGFAAEGKDAISGRDAMIEEAKRQYAAGSIITLMWHAVRPMDDEPNGWRESVQNRLSDFEWSELLTPGTNLNRRWLAQIDVVAGFLKRLQDAKIPVIWRPYHEANGGWFWWGGRKGEKGFAALYRMMYERFVNYHHLDNLIWVWNSNAPTPNVGAYVDFYPGAQYCDVLATDVYGPFKNNYHDDLVELANGKPIALGEVGVVPAPAVFKDQPKWAWFMVWAGLLDLSNGEMIGELFADPHTRTRGDRLPGKD